MDVIVTGAGPAGLAATAAFAARGLSVTCIAPEHPSPWPNTYGVWEDELEGLELADCHERRYDTPVVYTGTDERRELDRAYLRVDNEKLRERLLERCERHGVRFVEGFAKEAKFQENGAALYGAQGTVHSSDSGENGAALYGAQGTVHSSNSGENGGRMYGAQGTVHTADIGEEIGANGVAVYDAQGTVHRAAILVDATGHKPQFVAPKTGQLASAFQVAYGYVASFEEDPIGGDGCVLMDFRDGYLPDDERAGAPPTFLYAMRLGDRRYFVEETSLVARPPLEMGELEDRLAARLRHRGVSPTRIEEVERCVIPMDPALPELDQPAVGFGAAAGMVHPATGYQLGAALRTAPALAEAVAAALEAGASPREVARKAWRAVWPVDKVRARRLWLAGLEALLGLDAAQTRRFFNAFFSLPDEQWQGYMSGTHGATETARAMWSMFSKMPASLKLSVGWGVMGSMWRL